MIRFLLTLLANLVTAAVALLIAWWILPDQWMTVQWHGFFIAVAVLALVQAIIGPFIFNVARKHASALLGGIGRARRSTGEILAVDSTTADVTGVRCRLNTWPGHRPGQFAFVTFDPREGAHPFTLASADRGDHTVDFQIKALGDYTRKLAGRLRPGQKVQVEGPYGRFDLARCHPDARQIWIAGGIGITPFLAWLEALQGRPAADVPPASLYYCTRDRAADPFVARLENLCAGLPGVSLHVHGAQQGERLGAAALGDTRQAEIWFCGPGGLADSLRGELASLGRRPRFHQEAFEMR